MKVEINTYIYIHVEYNICIYVCTYIPTCWHTLGILLQPTYCRFFVSGASIESYASSFASTDSANLVKVNFEKILIQQLQKSKQNIVNIQQQPIHESFLNFCCGLLVCQVNVGHTVCHRQQCECHVSANLSWWVWCVYSEVTKMLKILSGNSPITCLYIK